MKWEEIEEQLRDHVRSGEDSPSAGEKGTLPGLNVWMRVRKKIDPGRHLMTFWWAAASIFLILSASVAYYGFSVQRKNMEITRLEAELDELAQSESSLSQVVRSLRDSLDFAWQDISRSNSAEGIQGAGIADESNLPARFTREQDAADVSPENIRDASMVGTMETSPATRNRLPEMPDEGDIRLVTDAMDTGMNKASQEGAIWMNMNTDVPDGYAGEDNVIRFSESNMASISDELQKASKKGLVRYRIQYSDINTNTEMNPRSWELTITYQ